MTRSIPQSRQRKGVITLDALSRVFPEPMPFAVRSPLVVHHLLGRGNRLIVSFAGVGFANGPEIVPKAEFVGTASNYGENHALFVSDVSRSWMNGPDVADQIVDLIQSYCEDHDIQEIMALGNSMGGFMAIVLAELTHLDCVLAFAPQFSAKKDLVPEENRWERYRSAISNWRFDHVGKMAEKKTCYYVVHGDKNGELPYLRRFPVGRNIHHFVVQNAGHNIARKLQKRQRLNILMQSAVQNRSRRFRIALEQSFKWNFHPYRREIYESRFLSGDPQ